MSSSSSSSPTSKPQPPDQQQDLQDQMDHVLNLIQQPTLRYDQVDKAVSTVLSTLSTKKPSIAEATTGKAAVDASKKRPPPAGNSDTTIITSNKRPRTNGSSENGGLDSGTTLSTQSNIHDKNATIRVDMGNYDDDDDDDADDDDDDEGGKVLKETSGASKPAASPRARPTATHTKPTAAQKYAEQRRLELISDIPMGPEASKMMIAFGDGNHPVPETVQAALLGTRQTLQLTIMDARVVRRRLQSDFTKARLGMNQYVNKDVKNRVVKLDQQRQKNNGDAVASPAGSGTAFETEEDTRRRLMSASALTLDSRTLYRALAEGKDRLGLQAKCGFDMEELTQLYPEEMNAYQKYQDDLSEYLDTKEVADGAYTDETGDVHIKGDGTTDQNGATGDAGSSPSKKQNSNKSSTGDVNDDQQEPDEPDGSRLKVRAAQFDVRTDRMSLEWYATKFHTVRSGSFLKKTVANRQPMKRRNYVDGSAAGAITKERHAQRNAADQEWDELRNAGKGRKATGTWDTVPPASVRFLHWLGFDPPNLCPPDDEVTGALAFLAYDRLGRIIEKAIYLRNMLKEQHDDDNQKYNYQIWEMPPGEQLSKEDIERSLQDPDVKPTGIYTSTEQHDATAAVTAATAGQSFQLYFGKGFEDRLELEMDEMIASTTGNGASLSAEEQRIRNADAELLAKISAPPVIGTDGLEQVIRQKKSEQQPLQKKKEKKTVEEDTESQTAVQAATAAAVESAEDNESKANEQNVTAEKEDDEQPL